MSRVKIFLGATSGLIGLPCFILSITDHSVSAGAFIWSAVLVAFAVAMLAPRRWS